MSYIDLQSTLREWPYDPEQISVRKILGADGEVRIQMRIELGVLQMEAAGRPDGRRPNGCDSVLTYQQRRIARLEERSGKSPGQVLTPEHCQALREEASIFYRRYVALFVLEEFEGVIRDTEHTLGIFDLCREHAQKDDDRQCLEKYRPYVLMMNARAQAYLALQEEETTSALAHINRGIMRIVGHFDAIGKPEAAEKSEELNTLRNMSRELADRIPQDSLLATRRALRQALEQEHFEEAARLRDSLKNWFGKSS